VSDEQAIIVQESTLGGAGQELEQIASWPRSAELGVKNDKEHPRRKPGEKIFGDAVLERL